MARWLCTLIILAFSLAANAQLANNYQWAKFRGNSMNSGYSLGANAFNVPLWQTHTSGSGLPSSPAIGPDGTVYIGIGTAVTAMDGVTGIPGWTYTAGGTVSTPAVSSGGTVYVGSANTTVSSGNNVYALNGGTGSVLWTYPASGPVYSSPAIGNDGTVYAATWDGYVLSLNGSTGSVNWKVKPATNGSDQFQSSPAIGPDGIIYIGSFNGNLYAINPSDGTTKWIYATAGHIASSPAFSVFGANILTGSTGTIYVGCDDSRLYAVDSLGGLDWVQATGAAIVSSPAVGPDFSIYACSEDHSVYSFSPGMGTMNWTYTTNAPIDSSPAVGADGTVYIGPDDGNVYALNGSSGALNFSYGTSGANSSPAINALGNLIVGTGTSVICLQSVYVDLIGVSPTSILAGQIGIGTIDLNQVAPAGGAYVGLVADNPAATVPSFIIVPQGQKTAQFIVQANGVNSNTVVNITANPGIGQTTAITVLAPQVISISLDPSTVKELDYTVATVVLNGPVGPKGAPLSVTSSSPFAHIPPNPMDKYPPSFGPDSSSTSFPITTTPVDNTTIAQISAMFGGATVSAPLTILPATLIGLTLDPTVVAGGLASVGTLTFDLPAGPSGTVVTVTSNTASARVPNTTTVPSGATSGTFTILTSGVAQQVLAQIVANLRNVAQSATLTINPIQLASVNVVPASVLGGAASTGTVTMNGPVGAKPVVVNLKSSSSAAKLPATVTVASGLTSASFQIATTSVTAVTKAVITATQGEQTATTTLTVNPPTPASVTLNPSSVLGGTNLSGTVTLDGPALTGGTTVTLASSASSAMVPASIIIPAGAISGTFAITTTGVNATATSTISASSSGVTQTAVLTITPTAVSALSFSPASVVGGNPCTGTITLIGPAAPGGTVVTLSSGNSIASVPASITVPGGQRSGTFAVITKGVTQQTYALITATFNGSVSATLVIGIASLSSVTVTPSTAAGLTQPVGAAILTGPAGPSGVVVTLASDTKDAVVPKSVTIPYGQVSATFPVATVPVTVTARATLTASYNNVSRSTILTLVPIALESISVSPSTVAGGTSASGIATLNGLAPRGGVAVRLSSSKPGAVVPGSVTVLAGNSTASFTVKTTGVAVQELATITGRLGTGSESASLTITPPEFESITVDPSTVSGGASSTGTVTLGGEAPPSGLIVKLFSSVSHVIVPASVTIAGGKSSAVFTVKTTAVASQSVATISGTSNGVVKTTELTVTPTELESISLKPTTVVGGKTSVGTVTLSGPAPTGGFVVALSTNSSDASVPASVTVLAGKTSATFTVKTVKVTSSTSANISAAISGTTKVATLTIT